MRLCSSPPGVPLRSTKSDSRFGVWIICILKCFPRKSDVAPPPPSTDYMHERLTHMVETRDFSKCGLKTFEGPQALLGSWFQFPIQEVLLDIIHINRSSWLLSITIKGVLRPKVLEFCNIFYMFWTVLAKYVRRSKIAA